MSQKLGPTSLIQGLGWADLTGQVHFDNFTPNNIYAHAQTNKFFLWYEIITQIILLKEVTALKYL